MKSLTQKITAIFALLLVLPMQFVIAIENNPELVLSDYAYYKEIQGEISGEFASVVLDSEIYQHSNFTDLAVVDESGNQIPFQLLQSDYQNMSQSVKVIDSSGSLAMAEKLLDGDGETFFELDQGTKDPAWKIYKTAITFDLGEEMPLNVVDFVLPKFAKYWDRIEVSASSDNVVYSVVKPINLGKSAAERFLHFEDLQTRYLKIDFLYGDILSIAEVSFYTQGTSTVIFPTTKDKKYKLYYGNLKPVTQSMETDFHLPKTSVLILGSAQTNPDYNSDFDLDGVENFKDNCPFLANIDQMDNDGDGMGDLCDSTKFMHNQDQNDFDFDGVGDFSDNCIYLKNPNQRDLDGDKIGDFCDDDDGDMILNFEDNCPDVKNYAQADADGNGIGDVCEGDSDQDGVPNVFDNCPQDFNADQIDTDLDGKGDVCDNCAQVANSDQKDTNQNKTGDACEDTDGDGILDLQDNCPKIANADQKDSDEDNVGDVCDNCPNLKNSSQWDDDNDGVGNECEDDDADGVLAQADNCPNYANADQKDSDNNGIGDVCEDFDGDEIIDLADNCVKTPNADQIDEDRDGIGDACDPQILVTKPPYLFYGLLAVLGLGVLYYAVKLVHQIKEGD